MKKTYIAPLLETTSVKDEGMVCASPGVNTGNKVENKYNVNDRTYSKGTNTFNFIGNDDE